MDTRALWYVNAGKAEIRRGDAGAGAARVETLWTGLSRGTERLIFEGRVPESERTRMRCPMQEGEFPFPVKYGYCNVGRVTEGPEGLEGRICFSLAPHQAEFRCDPHWLNPLPDAVPARRAILSANAETALNAVWDAELVPGAPVAVIGAGVVGCLTAFIARHVAGAEVLLVDRQTERAGVASALGLGFAADVAGRRDFETVFHTSASAAGLAAGLDALAFEGTLVEMSWYGAEPVPVPLGAAFHSQRLRLLSSQVGHVARPRRATHGYRERMAEAMAVLSDPRLDALITGEVAFEELPARLPALLGRDAAGIATAVRYRAEA